MTAVYLLRHISLWGPDLALGTRLKIAASDRRANSQTSPPHIRKAFVIVAVDEFAVSETGSWSFFGAG